MYVVARKYGKQKDYLSAWDGEYGTICRGNNSLGMRYLTKEDAASAASEANRVCVGYRGSTKPDGMFFEPEKYF